MSTKIYPVIQCSRLTPAPALYMPRCHFCPGPAKRIFSNGWSQLHMCDEHIAEFRDVIPNVLGPIIKRVPDA